MRFVRLASLASLALLAVQAALPPAAQAGGFSNPDFGIRRLGMFAVTAKADDPTAIFHNPAGLTLQDGTHLYHAQSWFFMDLGFKIYNSKGELLPKDRELKPDWSIGAIPFLGVATDFGTKNWRGGLAVYAPNAYGAAMSDKEATRYHATRALFIAPRATAAVAYKFNEKFSIGASLSAIYVYLTAKRYLNPFVLADPDKRFDPPAATRANDYLLDIGGTAWTWAWDVGIMVTPLPTLRLGAAFASGSDFTLKGPVKATKLDGTKSESATQNTKMNIPFTLRFGFNWEFVKDFELGADIYWWHYQTLQEQRSTLSKPLLGGAVPGFVDPKNYGNSWAWNVGLMYRLLPNLELMAGWQMDFTPIPTSTYSLDNPSTDQCGVSFGARWAINKHVRVGLAFVRNWFKLINVQDSQGTPPTNAKGHGANQEVGFEVEWKL